MSSIRQRRAIRRINPRNYSPAVRTYFNAVNRLKSRRYPSRRAKRTAYNNLRRIFKNSIRERNRRILISKLSRGDAYKRAQLQKYKRKKIAGLRNTQQRNIAQATKSAIDQIGERNRNKPVQTQEKARQQQQENQQSGSGIENVTKKLGAAISTVANIHNAIPRDFSETISVQDINSVTENDEKINELNERNRQIAGDLKKNIDNLREFDRDIKRGLSNAQCGIGKKCFTNEADITPQKVVDKLTKAYSDVGENNKQLEILLNSQCGNIPCFNKDDKKGLYDKDGKLTSNEAIRKAVIKKITELENLRTQEKIASADLMTKSLKAQKLKYEAVLRSVKWKHRKKLATLTLSARRTISQKMKQIEKLKKNKKDLEETNKKLIEDHAVEIAAKQSVITKLEGEKETLNNKLKETEEAYKKEILRIKRLASNKIRRLEYFNRIYKRLWKKERAVRISLDNKLKKANTDRELALDAKKAAEKARDEALAAASSSEKAKAEAEKAAEEATAAAAAAAKDAEKSRKEAEEAKKEQTKAQEEKQAAEKARDEASSALNDEKEKLEKLKKEKGNLQTSLDKLEIEKNNLVQENNKLNDNFKKQNETLKAKQEELDSTSNKLASQTLQLNDQLNINNKLTKQLSKTKSAASKKIKELEKTIADEAAAQKITIESVKANYKAQIKNLETKHEKEKTALKKKEMNKMNARIIQEQKKYNYLIAKEKYKTITQIKIHNLEMERIKTERKKEKEKMEILQSKYNNVSYLKEKYRKESQYKDQLYKLKEQNLKRKQLNEINIYKQKQNNLISSKNAIISKYKARSIENFKAGYASAQRIYNRKLQLKNAEIIRLRSSGSRLLLTYKKAQIKAENIAKARGRIIRNLANAYNRSRISLNVLRANNIAKKLKYASLLRKRDNLIKSKNNIINYYRTKTSSLRKAISIEKAKNVSIASQNTGLRIANIHLNNMNNANKNLINKQKVEISKLKDIEKKLKDKETSLTNQINNLKQTTKKQTEKINKYIENQASQNRIISELRAKQYANLATISKLQSELKSKIYVSECGSRGYTKTSGINKNVHFFNGKKYIREDSIIGDKIKLNGKDYVKLINGKCLNQYSRPCPKPKIIFKKSTRSATTTDLVKHNILYRKYRCAVINNTRNKRVAYRRWIQQRNLIRAKTRKYPRYPPFNSRMCGRSRGGSRGGSRCVGTCARYRNLINSHRSKIAKLQKQNKFYQSRLTSYSRLFRRYNGTQRGTPAYNYKMAYIRYLNLYRRTRSWPWRTRRRKAGYRVLYYRYLSLLKREIAKGKKYSRLISVYARNVSSIKRQINNYNNAIKIYQRKYPRQLR